MTPQTYKAKEKTLPKTKNYHFPIRFSHPKGKAIKLENFVKITSKKQISQGAC